MDVQALVAPFSTAVAVTFQEWAGTEMAQQSVRRATLPETVGEMAAVIAFESGLSGFLALHTSRATATALAQRTFAEVGEDPEAPLVCDWLGEAANIVAGQAKALLAGTPYHFTFSPPRVGVAPGLDLPARQGGEVLAFVFGSDVGDVTLQVCLDRAGG